MAKRVLVLFDMDGTLTPSRQAATPEINEMLMELRKKVTIGMVGGSDLAKQMEQLGSDLLNRFDFVFSQNGLQAYKHGELFHQVSFVNFLGDEKLTNLVNFTLKYIAELDIPKKRGTFFELRTGMVNISPVGRNCSHDDRVEFEEFDKIHQVRQKLVEALKKEFSDYGLHYAIGGQISIDVFPQGWDKTYALQFVEKDFDEIHFFGDKTAEGGNDFEIFNDPRTIGHRVVEPQDTLCQVTELFLSK